MKKRLPSQSIHKLRITILLLLSQKPEWQHGAREQKASRWPSKHHSQNVRSFILVLPMEHCVQLKLQPTSEIITYSTGGWVHVCVSLRNAWLDLHAFFFLTMSLISLIFTCFLSVTTLQSSSLSAVCK